MPERKNKVVIIDTNLWISFLLTKDISQLDRILSDSSVVLLFSEELYNEFHEVARRPKFRKYFALTDMEDISYLMKSKGKLITVFSIVEICRDSKDDFLLSLAKDGKATHLITGDKDLLDLKRFGRTRILSISDFLKKSVL